MVKEYPAIWLFDSVCVLCEGAVQYTLRHEKAPTIQFVSIQSERGRLLAMDHGVNPDEPDTFLFIENGIAQERSDGVMALAKHLNGVLARTASMGVFIPKFLRDFAYDRVALNRYKLFGKKGVCLVPNPETMDRFVL